MLIALVYLLREKQFTLRIPLSKMGAVSASVLKIGIAPFGLAMSPNISLIMINRFSVSYGGDSAIATYACITYVTSVIYLPFLYCILFSMIYNVLYRFYIWIDS